MSSSTNSTSSFNSFSNSSTNTTNTTNPSNSSNDTTNLPLALGLAIPLGIIGVLIFILALCIAGGYEISWFDDFPGWVAEKRYELRERFWRKKRESESDSGEEVDYVATEAIGFGDGFGGSEGRKGRWWGWGWWGTGWNLSKDWNRGWGGRWGWGNR